MVESFFIEIRFAHRKIHSLKRTMRWFGGHSRRGGAIPAIISDMTPSLQKEARVHQLALPIPPCVQAQATPNPLPVCVDFLFWVFHINGTIRPVVIWDGLPAFNMFCLFCFVGFFFFFS